MKRTNVVKIAFLSCVVVIASLFFRAANAAAQTADANPAAIAKRIGVIKTINGNAITLAPESGADVAVTVEPAARLLRLNPGEKDLKNAATIQLQDLKVGDQVRVRGHAVGDGIDALEVLVISGSAVDAVRQQIQQDWQKRGIGGRAESVDSTAGSVILAIPTFTGKKTVTVRTTKTTVVHRYAPDSAKPEDAKSATLQDIHPGDQVRARGNRNADGSEITAEEIYAGAFPQFAATVKSVDARSGTLSLLDLATKKTVEVKVTPDSQVHKIPPELAQGMAMQVKRMMAGGTPGTGAGPASTPPASTASASIPMTGDARSGAHVVGMGQGTGMRQNGPPDLQRMLSRLPSSTLAGLNLQKGDAVIVLATEGTPSGGSTAVTLLSGVEPILQAAPSASQAMMLSPWNLGGAAGGDAAQ